MNHFPLSNDRSLSFLSRKGLALGLAIVSVAGMVLAAQPGKAAPRQIGKRKPPVKPKQSRTATRRSVRLLKDLENLFVPPKGNAPQTTANSATRDPLKCSPEEAVIEAFVPPLGYGLSSRDRPAITLNLPTNTAAQQVALLFRDESGDIAQRALLPIPKASLGEGSGNSLGVPVAPSRRVQFQLPASSPGLLPGQLYHWSLVVVCGDSVEPDDPTFMGWVKYQAPTFAESQALAALSLQDKVQWYGQRGYWYDMVLK